MSISISNWMYPVFLLLVLLITGAAEFIKIAPAGSFYTVLLLVLGIAVPSPVVHTSSSPSAQAVQQNTQAVADNTAVTKQNTAVESQERG